MYGANAVFRAKDPASEWLLPFTRLGLGAWSPVTGLDMCTRALSRCCGAAAGTSSSFKVLGALRELELAAVPPKDCGCGLGMDSDLDIRGSGCGFAAFCGRVEGLGGVFN